LVNRLIIHLNIKNSYYLYLKLDNFLSYLDNFLTIYLQRCFGAVSKTCHTWGPSCCCLIFFMFLYYSYVQLSSLFLTRIFQCNETVFSKGLGDRTDNGRTKSIVWSPEIWNRRFKIRPRFYSSRVFWIFTAFVYNIIYIYVYIPRIPRFN